MNVVYPADDLRRWLDIATAAAREGGRVLTAASPRPMTVTAETARDVKLDMDRQSEQRILDLLGRRSPFGILSEECGAVNGSDGGDLQWVVDPLDGSFNYLRGIPLCCVSVALCLKDEPLLGVVYDFNRQELYAGIVGQGAWLNDLPVRVSDTVQTERAVLCTGFPAGMDFSADALLGYVESVRRYKKMRLLGSAALMLAYVAAGRADAYYERDIKVWDVAAGLALVRAAGGSVEQTRSTSARALTVYASNGALASPFR